MPSLQNKTVAITGATKGFGEQLARKLAAEGARVVGIARTEDKLREMASQIPGFSYIRADLSSRENARQVVGELYEKHGGANVFVFNAGLFDHRPVEELPDDAIDAMFGVNLIAPTHLYRYWLKDYDEGYQKPESAVWLASVSSLKSWPGGDVYQLTKTGLAGFSYARRIIERKAGPKIRHLAFYPGTAETEMTSSFNLPKIPRDVITDTIVKGILGEGDFDGSEHLDVAVVIPDEDRVMSPAQYRALSPEERKAIYAVLYSTTRDNGEPETIRRPDLYKAKLVRLAGPEAVIRPK